MCSGFFLIQWSFLVSAVGRFSVNRKTTQRKDSVLKINSASLQQWVVWVVLGPLGRFSVCRFTNTYFQLNKEKKKKKTILPRATPITCRSDILHDFLTVEN